MENKILGTPVGSAEFEHAVCADWREDLEKVRVDKENQYFELLAAGASWLWWGSKRAVDGASKR